MRSAFSITSFFATTELYAVGGVIPNEAALQAGESLPRALDERSEEEPNGGLTAATTGFITVRMTTHPVYFCS